VGGLCSTCEGEEKYIQGFGGENLKGKKPVGRPRRRWEHNIKVGLQVTGWEGVNYLCLAQDENNLWAVVYTAVSLLVP